MDLKSATDIVAMDAGAFADHVEVALDDPGGPAWDVLLSPNVAGMTHFVLGQLIADINRLAAANRRLVKGGEWTQQRYEAWWGRDCRDRMDLLTAAIATAKEALTFDSTRRRVERCAAEGPYPFKDTPLGLLRTVVGAIYWHRRRLLEDNLQPGPADLELWRSILRLRQLAGDEESRKTLDELWGSGRHGAVEWPADFEPDWSGGRYTDPAVAMRRDIEAVLQADTAIEKETGR